MPLVDYSTSEDEEDFASTSHSVLPPFSSNILEDKVRFTETNKNSASDGRVRCFSHQHGSWATSVYIPATDELTILLNELLDHANSVLLNGGGGFNMCRQFHLSLSRTWPILHHWIADFQHSIRDIAYKYPRPLIRLSKAELLVNDEGTRSFLAVCTEKSDFLVNILSDVDEVVRYFRGEPYYKDQMFHFSLSWCLGNVNTSTSPDWREACLGSVNTILSSLTHAEDFELTTLVLKTGDKISQFPFCKPV